MQTKQTPYTEKDALAGVVDREDWLRPLRKLKARWNPEMAEDLKAFHGIEIAEMLANDPNIVPPK